MGGSRVEHEQETRISVRKFAILALLAAPDGSGQTARPIAGSTRLQKLLFLLWTGLPRVADDRQLKFDLSFQPERFGPADLGLYPDLDFLEALGHVARTRPGQRADLPFVNPESSVGIEEATERSLSFDYLMGDEEGAALLAEAEETEETLTITPQGLELLARLRATAVGRSAAVCERILELAAAVRTKFGQWPLPRLLRYVYSEFPAMTTRSEIRERVLGSD